MYHSKDQTQTLEGFQFAFLKHQFENHILTLTLNRAEKKNALHPVMVNELAFAMAHAHHNTDVWMVVLAAEGDTFCAGADLKAFAGGGGETNSTVPESGGEVLLGALFARLHKPCIAKVQGNALAGAFLLLCGCTHVVAAEHARFGLPEVKRGIFPFQVMASLLEIMPPRRVLDWCIGGYDISAQTAMEWGLVSKITSSENLDQEVSSLCESLLQNSPSAIRLGLEAFSKLRQSHTAEHQYLREMLFQTLQTEDGQEGLSAFMQKRTPVWKGK